MNKLVEKVCSLHLTEIFEEVSHLNKEKIAIEFKNESITFSDLNVRVNQVSNFLVENGVKPISMVSLCMERSLEMVIWILGILRSGGIYIPIVSTYPKKRIEVILEETKCEFCVISSKVKGLFDHPQLKGVFISDQIQDDIFNKYATEMKQNVSLKSDDTSCCFFTSGSTGVPKGIIISSKNISHNALLGYESVGLTENDKYGGYASIIFTVSLTDLFTPLLNGITLVLFPEEYRRDPGAMKNYVNEHQITCFHCTPAILKLFPRTPFTHPVTFIRVGGESSDYETLKYWASQVKMLHSAYGMTESSGGTTLKIWEPKDDSRNVGKGWGTSKAHIMDDHMKPITTPGITGELFMEGLAIAKGYYNLPVQNRETFLENPFYDPNDICSSPTILKTGDYFKYSDSFDLLFVGRIDHETKIRGNRINVLEIESVIRKLEYVQNAIVGVKRTEAGSKRLVAYIILAEEESKEESEFEKLIQHHLQKTLPDFMIPNNYVFLEEEYPKTVSGKIDRIALERDVSITLSSKDHVEARNETEKKLTELWRDVLNIREESEHKIGIFDGFYELGGNSLLLTILMRKINDTFQKAFSPLSLLRDGGALDISRLAILIGNQEERSSSSSFLIRMIQTFREHEMFVDWDCEPPTKYFVLTPSNIGKDEKAFLEEISVLNTNTYLEGNPIRVHLKMAENCAKEWHEHNKKILIDSYEERTLIVAKNANTGVILGHYSNCNFEGLYPFDQLPWEMKVEKTLYDRMKKNAQQDLDLDLSGHFFEDSIAVIPNLHPSIAFFLGVLGKVIAKKRGFKISYFTPTAPTTQKQTESYSRKYYRSHKKVYFDQFEYEGKKVFSGIRETYLKSITTLSENEKKNLEYTYVNGWTKNLNVSMEEILGLI